MTALGDILAGARIIADDVAGVAPNAVIKQADQDVLNSATLQNDDALFVSLPANTAWLFWSYLNYEGAATGTGDLKIEWTAPSGATVRFAAYGPATSGVSTLASLGGHMQGVSYSFGTNGSGSLLALTMLGSVLVGSTPGALQLEWAQSTANNSTATIVHAQSHLALWQVA